MTDIERKASQERRPVLYSSYDSDTSWRVRIALYWKNVEHDTIYIDMAAGEHLSEAYSKLNPFQKLPCFITKSGKVLTQSLAIIEYLERAYPDLVHGLRYCVRHPTPPSFEQRLDTLSGLHCVADQISVADFCLVPMVYAAKRHKVDMKPYPNITRIRNTLMTLPEFRNTHPYNQPDCPPDAKGIVQ
ncbi:hypothetical protein INT47_005194 [Mucor saturninus]|uniref:Maleylacetoacetate isomerase n=1 Tax=Mucor saturninus TaxID=64648 RepID=A0A8H7QVV4_9FUNG|nr:hypothetical protein INT47_005194 [Mucor saturninus]